MKFDTITAISTPLGEGAIAIVRVSGDEAVKMVNAVFQGKNLEEVPTHTIHYGYLIDPESNEKIEEVMVSMLRGPKTFTREDVVEINCHGGLVSVNKVLQLILMQGARLAEPGEFTKRAFLNGRIDLSQAEAIMDLIRAKTDDAMSVALKQVEGRLSVLIKKLRQELLEILAQIEVNIDYPEYDDVEEMTHGMFLPKAQYVQKEIAKLLQTAKQGKVLREGISTVIVGRPNVGKSSLLNSLVQESKAIVTDIPGTTRDVIEEYVNVRGIALKLIDTAGIRETEDVVEKIGVERSKQVLKQADLVLLVLNYNEALSEEDVALFEAAQEKETIVIVNKTDLTPVLDLEKVKALAPNSKMITTSFKNDRGIEELEEAISTLFFEGGIESKDATYVTNARHITLLKQAEKAIGDAIGAVEDDMPIDMAQIDLTRAWELLGEIIGDSMEDSLINQLFSQFCLGK